MKNRLARALILIVLMALLTGCANDGARPERETAKRIKIENVDEAFEAILENSSKEFAGNQLIDDAFLLWVVGKCGVEAVQYIATYSESDYVNAWYDACGESIHVLWDEYCRETGFQNYRTVNNHYIDCDDDKDITFDFCGDLILAEGVGTTEYMDGQMNGILDCFSENLVEEMKSADVFTINNEFAYTDRGAPLAGKAYTFRANPRRVALLDEIGVDLVSLANNHIYDYGVEGVEDTLNTVKEHGLPYVGAGMNLKEAMKPVYFTLKGRKIAIVSATQIERSYNYTKQATEDTPGVLKTLDPALFVEVIKEADKNADVVLTIVHWGTEGDSRKGNDQVALAKAFVDAGADAIIGGHTHCLQGIEYMGDVPIYYSLGNYFFSSTPNMPAAYDTGLAQIKINEDGKVVPYFLPCRFDGGVVTLLQDKQAESLLKKVEELSSAITINTDGLISPSN